MTFWKIELTYAAASPAGTDLKHRLVVQAKSFDEACSAAMSRLPGFGRRYPVTKAGQAMTDLEVATLPVSGEAFVERGF